MQVAPAADWQRARERLAATAAPVAATPAPDANTAAALAAAAAGAPAQHEDARRFLLGVMNDPAVDLHLRIEAAKALLPSCAGPRAC